jgi:hypothetical protein
LVQLRLKKKTEVGGRGVTGWRVALWHEVQSLGSVTLRSRSLMVPWGSWQLLQFSNAGGCSHKKGPRLSVWQV